MKTSIPREEKGGGRKKGRGAWERGDAWAAKKERGERRGGEGGIYGAHTGVQNTLKLKLETKMPVGAKPEIST